MSKNTSTLNSSSLVKSRGLDVGFYNFLNLFLKGSCGIVTLSLAVFLLYFVYAFVYGMFAITFSDLQIVPLTSFLRWSLLGLLISVLATAFCWPLAIASTLVLKQESDHLWARVFKFVVDWLCGLPQLALAFLVLVVVAPFLFHLYSWFWLDSFSIVNSFTQGLAFSIAMLAYPFVFLFYVGSPASPENLFQSTLDALMSIGEMSLTIFSISSALIVFILPRMISEMRKLISREDHLRDIQVIRSLGGSSWDSLSLIVAHSMRPHFNSLFIRWTRKSFFECVLVFTSLNFLVHEQIIKDEYWGETLSVFAMNKQIFGQLTNKEFLFFGGLLLTLHLIFLYLSYLLSKKGRVRL